MEGPPAAMPPSGAPTVSADAHSARARLAAAARLPTPERMRKARQSGDGGRGDPGRPSPTPARAPGRPRQLLTSSPGGCARPPLTNQCSPHAARSNAGSAAAHTIPGVRLPPGRPGARSGCSLASRRTTEQPSCAPSTHRSTLLALLCSFAPSLPPISSSPSAAAPPPTANPPPRPQMGGDNSLPVGLREARLLSRPYV